MARDRVINVVARDKGTNVVVKIKFQFLRSYQIFMFLLSYLKSLILLNDHNCMFNLSSRKLYVSAKFILLKSGILDFYNTSTF